MTQIKWDKDRSVTFTGRNGTGFCCGLDATLINYEGIRKAFVILAPLRQGGNLAVCDMCVPIDKIGEVIEALQKIKADTSGRQKEKPVCGHCGSEGVVVDADADWNNDGQFFMVVNTFHQNSDGACCGDCGGACSIDWLPADTPENLYTMTDQPVTCPKCGARSEFEDLGSEGQQLHTCQNPECKYVFRMEEADVS